MLISKGLIGVGTEVAVESDSVDAALSVDETTLLVDPILKVTV